jgi:GNAT superfamily N-acetyltransferase
MITYRDTPHGITAAQLHGFWQHWATKPAPEAHRRILEGSDHVVLAVDEASGRVVGQITAISDGVSCAYIPHLEVLPEYRGRGIGSELVRRMLEKLRGLYMIDLMCDPELQPFYARFGLRPYSGMILRDYDRQSCE